MGIVFITGGARSGKSAFALSQAQGLTGEKVFIATARAQDEEMKVRIETHKTQRGSVWDTYEEPIKIAELIESLKQRYDVMLIDCLTLWLSNVMHAGVDVTHEMDRLGGVILAVPQRAGISSAPAIFIVSNEVGMGIVSENALARQFRDYQGILNQHIASIANEVYLMVAGIPVKIK